MRSGHNQNPTTTTNTLMMMMMMMMMMTMMIKPTSYLIRKLRLNVCCYLKKFMQIRTKSIVVVEF